MNVSIYIYIYIIKYTLNYHNIFIFSLSVGFVSFFYNQSVHKEALLNWKTVLLSFPIENVKPEILES